MASDQTVNNKVNGIYYTPTMLAEFLVRPLIDRSNLAIFDPSYGKGSLLLAAEKVFKEKVGLNEGQLHLFGCDIHPVNGLLEHLPSSNLLAIDFFEYSFENKFDIILMNPPYIRHHTIGKEKIKAYQKTVSRICQLNYTSDLWGYFLVKAIGHLKEKGAIAAILPWSFLQADYSRNLRVILARNFTEISVLALGAKYFDNAKERVVLVWLEDYGKSCKSIKISFSKQIEENISYTNIGIEKWNSGKVVFSEIKDSENILSKYIHDFGFSKFETHVDVRIGVVTGADNFFILSEKMKKEISASEDNLAPIYTSSKEISGLYKNGQKRLKNLLILTEKNSEKYKEYIKKGEEKGYHLRSHSVRRNPWYAVKIGKTPDAFFPYRMSKLPYLTRNNEKAQSTNSVHRIYFKNLSETEIKWIQISLISVIGQLSLERESKTYGRGMLKIEPKSLKNSIVYNGKDKSIDIIYEIVNKQLISGNKSVAIKLSTDFINKTLGIPKELSEAALSALVELQTRRLDR